MPKVTRITVEEEVMEPVTVKRDKYIVEMSEAEARCVFEAVGQHVGTPSECECCVPVTDALFDAGLRESFESLLF